MKKSIAILLVLLYLITSFRIALPYLTYQINKESIVAILCVNKTSKEKKCEGKCYLKKELSKAEKESKKSGSAVLENETIYSVITPSFSFTFNAFFLTLKAQYPQERVFYISSCLTDIFHPPAVI